MRTAARWLDCVGMAVRFVGMAVRFVGMVACFVGMAVYFVDAVHMAARWVDWRKETVVAPRYKAVSPLHCRSPEDTRSRKGTPR